MEPISLFERFPALQSIATNHLGSAVSSRPTDSSNHTLLVKEEFCEFLSLLSEGFFKSSGTDKSLLTSL